MKAWPGYKGEKMMTVVQAANYLAAFLFVMLDVRLVMGDPFCKVEQGGKLRRGDCYCYRPTDNRAEYR